MNIEADDVLEGRAGSRLFIDGQLFAENSRNLAYNFTSPLDSQYECPVCSDVLQHPVLLERCGHNCCASCLPEIVRIKSVCPIDQKPFDRETDVSVDKSIQREIDLLDVKCSFVKKGCTWFGQFKDLEAHTDECVHKPIACPRKCGANVERTNLRRHIAEFCKKREIRCEFCNMPILAEREDDHLMVCGKYLLPCPNGCRKGEVPRSEMQDHLDNKCSKQEIPCPFHQAGCDYVDRRKNMHKHIKEDPIQHLGMACDIIIHHTKILAETERTLTKNAGNIQTLEKKVDTLEKLYGCQLVWKIESWDDKVQEAKLGKKPTVFSPPFLTSRHGYRMAMSLCPYGDGRARGKFLSIFICICKGEFDALLTWPFCHRISFTLVDQCQDPAARRNISYIISPNVIKDNKAFLGRPVGDRNASYGAQKFVELDVVKTMDYVRDDTVFVKCTIDSETMINL
ncbi:TNF receptor-associated factor 5-like [Pecten maximus]|uniref:TNF receptor-associated factor 5-like n=1 Tax=Pecten maximus TaxID=6579 RepID=UPI001458A111|nr:TNF receptor-associated factor 5-like [Pecten maximus]